MQCNCRKSSRINTAIATNGLTTLLIARLDHREAIARLTLLKLIKVCSSLFSLMIQWFYMSSKTCSMLLCTTWVVICDYVTNFQVVYEHHPRPKQLIVENDLPQKLQNLIEERRDGQRGGQQVLVKQMATSLLKALHINTVLWFLAIMCFPPKLYMFALEEKFSFFFFSPCSQLWFHLSWSPDWLLLLLALLSG